MQIAKWKMQIPNCVRVNVETRRQLDADEGYADWKSAIQQVGKPALHLPDRAARCPYRFKIVKERL